MDGGADGEVRMVEWMVRGRRTCVPDELRFAEAGSGAEHGDRGAVVGLPLVDDNHVAGHRQRRHRIPHSHKVVEHLHAGVASAQHDTRSRSVGQACRAGLAALGCPDLIEQL